ncbi:MAG: hypothetical protein ACK5PF_08270 [bacterium]
MMQRPNSPPAATPRPMPGPTGRTPTGQPIMTMEDQERLRQWQLEQQAQAPAVDPAPTQAFPGTAPQMESPGLLADALDYVQRGFKWGQENLGGQLRGGVKPENNPTADGAGVGKGGRAREEELRRQEEEAVRGKQRR